VANPTRSALQAALASLENAEHGIAFSSGLGATTTLMHLVNPGERVEADPPPDFEFDQSLPENRDL